MGQPKPANKKVSKKAKPSFSLIGLVYEKLFKGDLKILGNKLPKLVITGLIGVIFMYIGTAGLVSYATPWWLGVGDAPRHIDYAWSVYNGHIPKFHEPLQYPAFNELRNGKYRNQQAAVNPPLFYALHAPIIGPLMKVGEWKKAIAAGRTFNLLLGVLTILALAWAGWLYGGKNRQIFAISVPALGALFYQFTNLNQNYANDILLILLTSLTFVAWYKLIQVGPKTKYLIFILLLSILGMLTKATYIVFLAINLLTVMTAYYLHYQKPTFQKIIYGGLVSTLILGLVIMATGWFYYFWNYKSGGSWFDMPASAYSSRRPIKSLSTVLTSSELWQMFYQQFTASKLFSIALTLAAVVGVALEFSKTRLKKFAKNPANLYLVAALSLAVIGVTMTQVVHAIGIGQFFFRYFLSIIFIFGLVLSFGLLHFKRLRGQLVSIALAIMIVSTATLTAGLSSIQKVVPKVQAADNFISKIFIEMSANGASKFVPVLLIFLPLAGLLLFAVAIFNLTRPVQADRL